MASLILSSRISAALSDFRSVVRAQKTGVEYEMLAYCYRLVGDIGRAVNFYGVAADISADKDEKARLGLNAAVLASTSKNDMRDTWPLISKVIETDPTFAAPYHFRAKLLLQPNFSRDTSTQLALSDIRMALSVGPSNTMLNFDAAHIFSLAAQKNSNDVEYETCARVQLTVAVDFGLPRDALRQRWTKMWAKRSLVSGTSNS